MRGAALLALGLSAAALPAQAQDGDGDLEAMTIGAEDWAKRQATAATPWSRDFLDPAGYTRLHVTARSTFTDGDRAFSSDSAWALEARAHLELGGGWSGYALIPLAILSRDPFGTDVFFGNVGAGASVGAIAIEDPQYILRWAAALEATAPTAARPDDPAGARRHGLVAAIRGRAPQLYIPRLGTVHARGHADLQWRDLTADFELGLMPGYTTGSGSAMVLLISTQARVAYAVTTAVEPYLELGLARQVAGAGNIAPPLWITPGVQLHVTERLHADLFVSLNYEEASAVVFGLDLAGLFRAREETIDPDAMDDFLQDDDW